MAQHGIHLLYNSKAGNQDLRQLGYQIIGHTGYSNYNGVFFGIFMSILTPLAYCFIPGTKYTTFTSAA